LLGGGHRFGDKPRVHDRRSRSRSIYRTGRGGNDTAHAEVIFDLAQQVHLAILLDFREIWHLLD
jgi:hypothetical protein